MHGHPPTIWAVPSVVETLLLPALTERALLVLDHVLAAEAAAIERLRPHAGSVLLLLPQRGLWVWMATRPTIPCSQWLRH